MTFTFGIQCNVCKQKVCRNCVTQVCLNKILLWTKKYLLFFKIAIPKEKLNDIPIHTFTPLALSKSIVNSERSYSLDNQ